VHNDDTADICLEGDSASVSHRTKDRGNDETSGRLLHEWKYHSLLLSVRPAELLCCLVFQLVFHTKVRGGSKTFEMIQFRNSVLTSSVLG